MLVEDERREDVSMASVIEQHFMDELRVGTDRFEGGRSATTRRIFNRMVGEYGPVEGLPPADRLRRRIGGLRRKLWEHHKLDMSVEALSPAAVVLRSVR